jgi:hypothetical protein
VDEGFSVGVGVVDVDVADVDVGVGVVDLGFVGSGFDGSGLPLSPSPLPLPRSSLMKLRASSTLPLPCSKGGGHLLAAPANSLGAEAKLTAVWNVVKIQDCLCGIISVLVSTDGIHQPRRWLLGVTGRL